MQRKEINYVIMLFIVFDKRESITAPLQIKNRIYLRWFLCKNDSLTSLHLNYKTENKNKTLHVSHKHYFVPVLSIYAASRRVNVVLTDTCREDLWIFWPLHSCRVGGARVNLKTLALFTKLAQFSPTVFQNAARQKSQICCKGPIWPL